MNLVKVELPFGAKVDFGLPRVNEPDHHGLLEFEPRGEAGLFTVWHFDPGYVWHHDYLVVPFEAFDGDPLATPRPFRVKEVQLIDGPFSFPLREAAEAVLCVSM